MSPRDHSKLGLSSAAQLITPLSVARRSSLLVIPACPADVRPFCPALLVRPPRLFDDLLDQESVISQLNCQASLICNRPERQRRSWPAVAAGQVSLTFEPTVSCSPSWMTSFVTLVDRQLCGSQSLVRFAESVFVAADSPTKCK
jgi:hypothetical protein